jgi:hypothetical protein
MLLDSSMLQYSQVSNLSKPKDSERDMLDKWIRSPSLGGGCDFLGRDLGGYTQPSVYAEIYQNDLTILNSDIHGEDDFFTRLLLGPVLSIFHRFWRHKKVMCTWDLLLTSVLTGCRRHSPLIPETQRLRTTRLHCIITMMPTSERSLTYSGL